MRNVLFPAIAIALLFGASAADARSRGFAMGTGSSARSHSVSPHITSRGTYVGGHHRTNPDSTRSNNYGSYGNRNPFTGGIGNGYGSSIR